ncbi:MAG: glycosyltransferase [Lachnospiraceae bacterium]|nr:glycosyltransferase [Lachnospiraceae bacterium]
MNYQKLPLVSVVIPTYNRIHTLPASVDSVLKQTYKNLELIIMDDGSTDGTEEYVKGIADERVRYRKAEKNMGPSAARNMGAELAKGEYLAFQDSDDEWMPDKLEKQMKLILDSEELSFVYSEFGFYRDGELLAVIPSRNIPYEEKQGSLFSHLLLYPLISTQTILIRTKDFIEAGGFNETLKAYEDFEFTLRFAQNHRIGFVQEVLVKVNSQKSSVSKQYDERIRVQFYMIREMLEPLRERNFLWRKLGIVLNETETLRCYETFAQELQSLSEELLSGEEQKEAASFLEKNEQGAENHQLRAQIYENLQKLKQKTLYIYEELYENRLIWSGEVQEILKEMVGSVELFGKVLPVPDKVWERRAVIQKRLSEENLAEADRLYLLADIVELFETLEKLW